MLTVIIPTLQKNKDILNALISSLVTDDVISEILLIDNSGLGYETSESKIRVITPKQNIFVNPAWNLGVANAKNEYFALFNDDLLVCSNFCSKVIELIKSTSDFGILGMAEASVINTQYPCGAPEKTNFKLSVDNGERPNNWGCIIFGCKKNWSPIPENIKISCGDDFIRYMERKQNRQVYMLSNAVVHHLGSLSCSNPKLQNILKNDMILYAQIDASFKKTIYYKWATQTKLKKILKKITDFFYKKKITKSGNLSVKICKIPLPVSFFKKG